MKHWFITGISRGLGLAIAKAALARGDRVTGTVRREAPELGDAGGRLHVIEVDMNDPDRVVTAVHEAFAAYGSVDVIVNNAGFGVLGAFETSSDEDLRDLFEVDVFAPIRISRTALPYLRRQGFGHIVNITSIAGRAPGVGAALYASAKFAMEGFSAALAQELAPFGIRVTAVAPGQFRTDFLSATSVRNSGGDAASRSTSLDAALETLSRSNHNQLGDPDGAARVILDAVYAEAPPLHLLLGSDALARARSKLKEVVDEMDRWEAATISTDFDAR